MSGTAAETRGDPRRSSHGEPSCQEIQSILGTFDAKINQMMAYPAKDVINALTMLAERVQYAPEIVSFLETKIHRAPPNYKLPIFYLTDSILKNVRGPYVSLLGRNIVPLYCNCVKQVSGKDLSRFVHVLNTWDQTRLFPPEALAPMRTAANRALAASNQPGPPPPVPAAPPAPIPSVAGPTAPRAAAPPTRDLELRSLLTQMQNDMGIHPTAHLTLEQVRVQNPEWYNQLVEYHMASLQPANIPNASMPPPQHGGAGVGPVGGAPGGGRGAGGGLLPTPPVNMVAPVPGDPRTSRPPRRSRFSDRPPTNAIPPPQAEPPKSASTAHLMELLRRKNSPPPVRHEPLITNESTNEHPRGATPNAAAVMSILQKLKGLNSNPSATPMPPPPPPPTMAHHHHQQQQQQQVPAPAREHAASKMWFSDKIVAHKDRVESNVQKLYAALPLVCRESGLRFKEQEKLNAHLDFLFQYNRAQKERGKGGMSRSWYAHEDQWVLDFSGDVAPRETTSSSFFDRKQDTDEDVQGQYDNARVPADEGVTRCMICGENFAKSWDEDEEDWMYTNAVYGTIHDASASVPTQDRKTIFHKYCYDTVMANSKFIMPQHLIPGTPQSLQSGGGEREGRFDGDSSGIKRNLDEEDSDSDDEDDGIKRIKTE